MIALLASFLISTNATARELVTNCRTMIPANVELSGRIILRNRKGIPRAARLRPHPLQYGHPPLR